MAESEVQLAANAAIAALADENARLLAKLAYLQTEARRIARIDNRRERCWQMDNLAQEKP